MRHLRRILRIPSQGQCDSASSVALLVMGVATSPTTYGELCVSFGSITSPPIRDSSTAWAARDEASRDMLFELVGGEPGAQLREQFVSGKCA
jgi:hypothetical protein